MEDIKKCITICEGGLFGNCENELNASANKDNALNSCSDNLPGSAPSDMDEFTRGIHYLQRHVVARLARRQHPDFFNGINYGNDFKSPTGTTNERN